MATVYRALMHTENEVAVVARSLVRAPLVDEAGRRLRLTIERVTPTRSVEQNRLMWALLTCISKCCKWPVNGEMVSMEPEDWKTLLTAGLTKNQRVAAGVEGGFVLLGSSTSAMDKQGMSLFLDFLYYFGSTHSVDFGRDALPPPDDNTAANDPSVVSTQLPQQPAALTHVSQGETA